MGKGDIRYVVTADTKKGKAAIKEFDDKIDKMGKTTQRAAGGFKNLAAGVAVGVAAFYAVTKALRGVVQWMGDAIDKAAIQEEAEKDVAAALESTGREVGHLSRHFKQYASKLQNATTFGDEQILSAQALMIQLTKLDREGLDKATKGAIGLASVYKTDLQAATTLVGKALAGNYGALSRYGIMVERTMTDEQKRVSILEQLQVMYSRAEAKTETYAGQVAQLGNVYGDLKEFVAAAVIENEAILGVITKVKEAMKDFVEKAKLGKQIKAYKELMEAVGGWTTFAEKAAHYIVRQTGDWGSYREVLEKLNEIWHKHGEITHETVIALAEGKEGFEGLQNWIWITYGGYLKIVEAIKPFQKSIKITTESIDTQIESIRGINLGMDFWGRNVIEIGEIYRNLQDTLISMPWAEALPSAEDLSGVLENAVPMFEGIGFIGEETMKGLTEAQKEGLAATGNALKAFGSQLATRSKAAAYAMAVINIAEGVTKALSAAIPPFNLILAGITAAAGAVQLATISSQAIPMAEGAIFRRPTYLVGEAGPEALVPLNKATNIFNQKGHEIKVYQNITINAQTLDNRTIDQAAEKIFRAVNNQARRHGYKL